MGAYNRRLEPKQMAGMPVEGVVSLVLALVFGTMTLIAPGIVRLVLGILFTLAIIASIIIFMNRKELQFLTVIIQSKFFEKNRVSSETRTRY